MVIALASSGLHSNGYSLVRRVLRTPPGWSLDRDVAGARPHPRRGAARADPGLRPRPARPDPAPTADRRRTPSATSPAAGWPRNLARVLPRGSCRPGGPLDLDAGPRSSRSCGELGRVPVADLERTLNLGVGIRGHGPRGPGGPVVREAGARGLPAWVLGEVERPVGRRRRRRSRSCTAPRASTAARCRSSAPTRGPERADRRRDGPRGRRHRAVGCDDAGHTRTPPPCRPVLGGGGPGTDAVSGGQAVVRRAGTRLRVSALRRPTCRTGRSCRRQRRRRQAPVR